MKLWFKDESIVQVIKNQMLLRQRTSKEKLKVVFLTAMEWECLKRELDASDDLELRQLLGLVEEFEDVEFIREDETAENTLLTLNEILMTLQAHLTKTK